MSSPSSSFIPLTAIAAAVGTMFGLLGFALTGFIAAMDQQAIEPSPVTAPAEVRAIAPESCSGCGNMDIMSKKPTSS
jgi:hypothetical protein